MDDFIERGNMAFCNAAEAQDPAAMAARYAPDATLLAPGADIVTGTEQIEAFWRGAIDQFGLRGVKLTTLSVTTRDDMAIELGRYHLDLDPGITGGPTGDDGKYVVVHRRESDGTWLWSVDSFSSNTAG